MKIISIRLSDEEHKIIKKYLIDKEQSFQQYVLELIRKDMKNK